jgi:hypothetical protein
MTHRLDIHKKMMTLQTFQQMIGKGETVNGYDTDVSPAVEIQISNTFFSALFVH